ncbi:MAG: FxsA family protein [Alphaproteobacteria bacterium]
MAAIVLLALILIPIVEITAFVEVGSRIGALATVGLVLASAALGIALIRAQGVSMLERARQSAARRELPLDAMFDGVCLAIAGVFLVLPGFVSDGLAFLLLLPPVRWGLRRWLGSQAMVSGHMIVEENGRRHEAAAPRVIEGEFRDVSPDSTLPKAPPDREP